jgi:hypothetical protein
MEKNIKYRSMGCDEHKDLYLSTSGHQIFEIGSEGMQVGEINLM